MDILSELRELGLASRLKRLSDRLMRDVSKVYRRLDIDFQARWFPILHTLYSSSPMTITSLAKSIRISHPAINQLASEMTRKDLIYSRKGIEDERERYLFISSKGIQVIQSLIPLLETILYANKELIAKAGKDFFEILGRIEEELDDKDMFERVWGRLRGISLENVQVVDYRSIWEEEFRLLNTHFLEEYVGLRKKYENYIKFPGEKIIITGGKLFIAKLDEKIIGSIAFLRMSDDECEFICHTVSEEYRGSGIGKLLLHRALTAVLEIGVTKMFVRTDQKQEVMNHLLKHFGFRKIKNHPFHDVSENHGMYIMRVLVSKIRNLS